MNLTTDDADGKIRLDQYLAAHLPELSRSRIQSLIKSGDVLVNGSPAKPKTPSPAVIPSPSAFRNRNRRKPSLRISPWTSCMKMKTW